MKIEFGFLNYKLLILLLFPIFYQIRRFVLKNETTQPLYGYLKRSISYSLSVIFYLLVIYRSRNHQILSTSINPEGRISAIDEINLENERNKKQRKIKKLTSVFLLSIINMIPMLAETFALNQEFYKLFHESFGILFAFLFYSFFSAIFLHSKIYKHQFISLFIISFCSLIFLFINIYTKRNEINIGFFDLIKTLLCFILIFGFYALYNVLVKNHFEIHLNNPYHLMLFIGLFSLILTIPLDLFVYFYDEKSEIFIYIINKIKSLSLSDSLLFFLKFIFDIISGFIELWGIILTLYYFTPCHYITSLIIMQILSKFISWISGGDGWFLIFIYNLLYGIIIFSSLVYNEIIIIHLWSMEKNTFKYISLRQKLEFEDSLNNYEENLTRLNPFINEESDDDN